MPRPIYALTGATSGMGLHVASRLAERQGAFLIAGARNPETAMALKAAIPENQLAVLELDISRLASVAGFSQAVKRRLDGGGKLAGIVCNAGLQMLGPPRLTEDGADESFATNYLGHFALVHALLDDLEDGAVVVTTGSGTHNPDDRLARMFGFRGADFPDAKSVALGKTTRPGSQKQLGMDRYATGKLCAILHARHMAGHLTERKARFFCFDPGLMPGTELARDRSAVERFGWRYILPSFRHLISGISTPRRSGYAMVDKVISSASAYASGSYIEFTGQLAPRSLLALRDDLARQLHEESLRICNSRA